MVEIGDLSRSIKYKGVVFCDTAKESIVRTLTTAVVEGDYKNVVLKLISEGLVTLDIKKYHFEVIFSKIFM